MKLSLNGFKFKAHININDPEHEAKRRIGRENKINQMVFAYHEH